MFEGKPPVAPAADHDALQGLRPLAWAELRARLTAAHDLRASLARSDDGGEASFDAGSARRLAAHHDEGEGEGEDAVNPEISVNGKGPRSKAAGAPPAARAEP